MGTVLSQQRIKECGFENWLRDIRLKIGEFDHVDAGQMNMFLNYYKENEGQSDDKHPIDIILCNGKK